MLGNINENINEMIKTLKETIESINYIGSTCREQAKKKLISNMKLSFDILFPENSLDFEKEAEKELERLSTGERYTKGVYREIQELLDVEDACKVCVEFNEEFEEELRTLNDVHVRMNDIMLKMQLQGHVVQLNLERVRGAFEDEEN